jgi:hypothetical protein
MGKEHERIRIQSRAFAKLVITTPPMIERKTIGASKSFSSGGQAK